MKKIIITIAFTVTGLLGHAQFKMYSSGKTFLGGTATTPLSTLDVSGNMAIGTYAGANAATSNGLTVSGNVGIGHNTPAYKLHVSGSDVAFDTPGDMRLYINHNTASNIGSIIFTTAGPGTGNGWAEIGLTGDNNLHFKANASAGTYSDRMTILGASGNVGIGNTTPASKLDVEGGISVGATYAGTTAAPSNGAIIEGNVGIGTTSISAGSKLDVSGDVNVSALTNAYRINGNIVLQQKNIASSIFVGNGAGVNVTGNYNTALGYQSLNTNVTGTENTAAGYHALNKNTGSNNTAFGSQASYSTSTGTDNCSFGRQALYLNSSGNYNCAFGEWALYYNIVSGTSGNCAFGHEASKDNTTGIYNVSVGFKALNKNTTAGQNTATGGWSLYTVTTASANVANGYQALYYNTAQRNTAVGYGAMLGTNGNSGGEENTAIGFQAGTGNTTGDYNTYIGSKATASAGTYTNCTALGYQASAAGDDQIQLGNVDAEVYCNNMVFGTSDGRFKINVAENVKGLEFIKKLRAVTYNMDTKRLDEYVNQNLPDSIKTVRAEHDYTKSSSVVHSGFIAQEVWQAGQDAEFISSIVHTPSNSRDPYSLAYSEFVVPLVKAVQELSKMVDSLETLINRSQGRTIQNNTPNDPKAVGTINVELSNAEVIVLNEAVPNPFAEQTLITYNIPEKYTTAQMLFHDNNGRLIRSVDIKVAGKGQMYVFANDLSNGIYSYTLVVNGKVIDTKKMIKQN